MLRLAVEEMTDRLHSATKLSIDTRCIFLPGPILIDARMTVVDAKWNETGSFLAVAGSQRSLHQDKDINVVQFFSTFGDVSLLQYIW